MNVNCNAFTRHTFSTAYMTTFFASSLAHSKVPLPYPQQNLTMAHAYRLYRACQHDVAYSSRAKRLL